jgi:hypothetical protein
VEKYVFFVFVDFHFLELLDVTKNMIVAAQKFRLSWGPAVAAVVPQI